MTLGDVQVLGLVDSSSRKMFVGRWLVNPAQLSIAECICVDCILGDAQPYPFTKVQLLIRDWMTELVAAVASHFSHLVVVGHDWGLLTKLLCLAAYNREDPKLQGQHCHNPKL